MSDSTSSPTTESGEQVYRFACPELRGGNDQATFSAQLPGLGCWVSSEPLRPSRRGGDLYFLSACNYGVTARVVLADVSGHGEVVSVAAEQLRDLLRRYVDEWDQSLLVRELNDSFLRSEERNQYATALLASFAAGSGELLLTNAGHPPPLWYRTAMADWSFLRDAIGEIVPQPHDLPLGLISGTPYCQTLVRFQPGDLLVLYTDGITEAENELGEQLGLDRLLSIARGLPTRSAMAAGQELLASLARFRGNAPAQDDVTLIALSLGS
jgi:sigma-B regulation protein RsbU (phosphoserine phosphatase)